MIHVDTSRCALCREPFDPPRRVVWGHLGFDMRHHLPAHTELAEGVVGRIEAPVCGHCWERTVDAIGVDVPWPIK